MNSAAATDFRQRLGLAIFLGIWSAAVALAPSWPMKGALAAPALLIPLTAWTLDRAERWIVLFFASALLLPPLPVALGDSGPHLCLLFAALGLWAGLARLGDWRIWLSAVHGALVALLAVLLVSVGSAALNSGAAIALGSLARVALFGISVYLFFYTTHVPGSSRPRLSWLYWFAAGSALFACIDFYFQLPAPSGYGQQFVWLDSGVYRRAQGFFYEASTLGNFCAFFLVMIAVALTGPRDKAPLSRKALLAGGGIFFAAMMLSYSRASVVNLAVALCVLAWLHRKRLRFLRLVFTLAALAASLAWLMWKIFPSFAGTYWLRLSATVEYLFEYPEGVLSGRLATWRTIADWIANNPWQATVGIGYKTLPYTDYLGAPLIVDNMYLSLLVEAGIAGLAALIWLNVAILRAAWGAAHSPDSQRAFCGTWMLCFWAGEMAQMASGDLLTYWRVLPVYFWVLALAMRR